MKGRGIGMIAVFISFAAAAQTIDNNIRKGNAYYNEARYDMAERYYHKALETTPQQTTALYNLANALYRQKKYDEAESVLTTLTTANASTNMKAAAYYNSGVIYSKQKDLLSSIDAYKKALRLNPNDKEARENLQKALGEMRQQQSQTKKQQSQSNMSQKQAEQKLQELAEKEKQLQQRLQNRNSQKGASQEKDW